MDDNVNDKMELAKGYTSLVIYWILRVIFFPLEISCKVLSALFSKPLMTFLVFTSSSMTFAFFYYLHDLGLEFTLHDILLLASKFSTKNVIKTIGRGALVTPILCLIFFTMYIIIAPAWNKVYRDLIHGFYVGYAIKCIPEERAAFKKKCQEDFERSMREIERRSREELYEKEKAEKTGKKYRHPDPNKPVRYTRAERRYMNEKFKMQNPNEKYRYDEKTGKFGV